MTPADFTEMIRTAGVFGTVLFILIGFIGAVLYYAKTKIHSWGEPWVQGQVKLVNSLKESTESQTTSIAAIAVSLSATHKAMESISVTLTAIQKSTDAQNLSTRVMTSAIAQLIDDQEGVTKEHVATIQFNLRKLEEHVLKQDVTSDRQVKGTPEVYQEPKLKLEPLVKEVEIDAKAEIEAIQEEMKPDEEPKP